MPDNACASGNPQYQSLDPEQFAPRGPVVRTGKAIGRDMEWKLCHLCEQETMIKLDGMFVYHAASIKGHVTGETAKLSGKPDRVRGRQQ